MFRFATPNPVALALDALALAQAELAQGKRELFPASDPFRNVLSPCQNALLKAQQVWDAATTPEARSTAAVNVFAVCRHRYLITNRPAPARRCLLASRDLTA